MARKVYGDMLAFFPELIRVIILYEKSPTIIAGHTDKLNLRPSSGVVEFCKAGDVIVNGNTLNDVDAPILWTRSVISMQTYIEIEEVEYRRTKNNAFAREGDFNVYVLNTVVGNTDTQTKDPLVDLGVSHFK